MGGWLDFQFGGGGTGDKQSERWGGGAGLGRSGCGGNRYTVFDLIKQTGGLKIHLSCLLGHP